MKAETAAPSPTVAQQDGMLVASGEPLGPTRASPRYTDLKGQKNHTPYDLLIIGAGPAGLVATREAVAAGARVALIESRHIGGNCLNEGCIPSKTILRSAELIAEMRNAPNYGLTAPAEVSVDFAAVMARMRRVRAASCASIRPPVWGTKASTCMSGTPASSAPTRWLSTAPGCASGRR